MEGCVKIDEILEKLVRERPDGVSFDAMSVRLLRKKIPIQDGQIDELKEEMFQMGDGLWFTREMITDDESQLEFREQAIKWLKEYGCFSVDRLFERFCGTLRHIATTEYFAIYLRHLGFPVTAWKKYGLFCFPPSRSLSECMGATAEVIAKRIEEVGGMLAFSDIEEMLPHLTTKALEGVRVQFLPEIHAAEIGEVPCWRSAEAVHLPEDFAEKLTTIVDTLVALKEKVSVKNLEFGLNLFFRLRFREEYSLTDKGTFLCVCAKHYQGANNVFKKVKKPRAESAGKIVSLNGKALSPTAWRNFENAGSKPLVAKWARRFENGESIEDIAKNSGFESSTMKIMISDFRIYLTICRLNNIEPKATADV